MDAVKWYEFIIGAALVISLIIGGFELISYDPESVISRENVCIAPLMYEGGLAGYWEDVISQTGIDAGTARLSRLKTDIGPDGTIDRIELEFFADKDGTGRQYQLSYRRDACSCGWSDGLSYPENTGVTPSPLPVNPGHILSDLGQIRSADMNLSGRNLVIGTETSPALMSAADLLSPDTTFYIRNGTLISPQPQGPDARTLLPFFLLVSERLCSPGQDGGVQCNTVPVARVFFINAS
jgi:hypothetical protein